MVFLDVGVAEWLLEAVPASGSSSLPTRRKWESA